MVVGEALWVVIFAVLVLGRGRGLAIVAEGVVAFLELSIALEVRQLLGELIFLAG